jgi:hypothetical protein
MASWHQNVADQIEDAAQALEDYVRASKRGLGGNRRYGSNGVDPGGQVARAVRLLNTIATRAGIGTQDAQTGKPVPIPAETMGEHRP